MRGGEGKEETGRDTKGGWWGCLGGGDASSESVDVTSWLRLNIQE